MEPKIPSLLLLLLGGLALHTGGTLSHGNVSLSSQRSIHVLERERRAAAVKPPPCYFPFIANGMTFTSCTMYGQTRGYWCATTSNFDVDGLWSWCNGPGTTSYLACYFPFLYKGVLQTACVVDSIGKWCSVTADYDRDGKGIYCLDDLKAASVSSISAATVAIGGGLLGGTIAPNTDTTAMMTAPSTDTAAVATSQAPSQNASLQTGTTASTTALNSPPKSSAPPSSSSSAAPQNGGGTAPAGGVTTNTTELRARTVTGDTVRSTAIGGGVLGTTTTTMAVLSPNTAGPAGTTSQGLPQNTPLQTGISGINTALASPPETNGSPSSSSSSSGPQNSGGNVPAGETTTIDVTSFNVTNSTDWQQLSQWLNLTSQNGSTGLGMSIIPALQRYTSMAGPSGLHKDEVALIVYILGNITEKAAQSNETFPISTVLDILYITNQLLNESSWKPASTSHAALGPQLLESFESILKGMSMSQSSFNVSQENIEFHCLVASCSNLTNQTAMRLPYGSLALSSQDSHQEFLPGCLVNVLLLSYKYLSLGFPDSYDMDLGAVKVDSDILTNVMLLDKKSYRNPNVNLSFQCNSRACDQTSVCVFWNSTTSSWSSNGCTTEVIDGITNCVCQHLTSFSVLMAKFMPESLQNSTALNYITITGLAISIVSLLLCIAFQVYVMNMPMNLMAYYRHTAILNVSIFLLLSNVSFIGASFVLPKDHLRLCVGLVFCTHFSLLAFFCWTLVQSIFLFCRLVFVFHHITKKEFMSLSVGLGYICPSAIAIWTFLYYTPTNDYNKDNACWLNSDSGASSAFSIPTIIVMSGNFLVLLVVIRKLLRPSISEGSKEDEEVIKKLVKAVIFCTPQFGLTWAVGIPLMTNANSLALHYVFDLLNPLQGFFIFIFSCLLDKKVIDMVKKRISKNTTFGSTATTVSSY